MKRILQFVACCALLLTGCSGQDSREALGPRDGNVTGAVHPITELMKSRTSALKPELRSVHPRVYFTDAELQTLRERSRTTHRALWEQVLLNVRALKSDPPPPPAETRRAQNEVGIAIAEAALVYRIEGDPKYLTAAKRYMDAAVSYEIWGYSYNKPNVDLAAGHLLYGMGMGYDLLYNNLTNEERTRYREKIARQAQLLADYYAPKRGRSYSYSQNHVFIPMAGLAVAAYAVYDEVPAAPQWAALARAIYDRVLATYSPDGYYYEGFEYWVFSTPWIIHYLDAHLHTTGEDLFDQPGLKNAHLYLAHTMAPGGQTFFDFGDAFEGPRTRAQIGDEYTRSHPGGRLHSNYNLLYRLAAKYRSAEVQTVAEWMRNLNHVNAEDFWTLAWQDTSMSARGIDTIQPWHHFKDHDVFFWRTAWTEAAKAFAFKAGPPEGHHTAALVKQFPDWHLSAGHAHPDANSFIYFDGPSCITGDSGYAGVPMAEHHNTLLVDGRGQALEGRGHDPWDGFSYDALNTVRIESATAGSTSFTVTGEAAGTYPPELGLTRFRRTLNFDGQKLTVVDDVVASTARTFTQLIHADVKIEPATGNTFVFSSTAAKMNVAVTAPQSAKLEILPNNVTAPGPPGSVDQGEVQLRGERLHVSTPAPTKAARFEFTFSGEPLQSRQ